MVQMKFVGRLLMCIASLSICDALSEPKTPMQQAMSRREIFSAGMAGMFLLGSNNPAQAFDNKISNKYDDRPKRRGSKVREFRVFFCRSTPLC